MSQQPGYGEYSLHARTGNKRTTLSALHMFVALCCEAVGNVRRAIMFCNKAISEDPGWLIPFSKRAEYFKHFGEYSRVVDPEWPMALKQIDRFTKAGWMEKSDYHKLQDGVSIHTTQY